MTRSEVRETEFTYFSNEEDGVIKDTLTKLGHHWGHNTVCGDCCGMYSDEYWVNGIWGKLPKSHMMKIAKAIASIKGSCCIYDNTIDANKSRGYGGYYIVVDEGKITEVKDKNAN